MWLYAAELGTATVAPSSFVHEIHSAAGHAAKHAQSLFGLVSAGEATDRYVVLLEPVPTQGLALVLDTASSSVEWFANSYPGVALQHSLCGSHATTAELEHA
jgi:hypothetical protein